MRLLTRCNVMGLLGGLLFVFMGCSEPAKEIVGTTSDGQFELVLRADPNWVRPSATLLVELVVRRLDPTTQLSFNDRISFVVNNGSVSPTSVTPSFAPEPGELVEKQVYRTWLEFRAPNASFGSIGSEQESEINALFRELRSTFKVRIVPKAGS
ncbi:MAG: hypothetical protein HOE48_05965 [Candidatus Latescibacteria bacterium]|nr:hypothetical protein [Candidatus Latescibacterota bacterium]